jgi:hypothetical protein
MQAPGKKKALQTITMVEGLYPVYRPFAYNLFRFTAE